MKRPSDKACLADETGELRDVSVGCNFALWDSSHDLPDSFVLTRNRRGFGHLSQCGVD